MERNFQRLLGFNIDSFGMDDALSYSKTLIAEKKGGQVVTINPEMIEFGLKNNEFAEIIKNADLIIPDGVGVKIGLKIKGQNAKRIAGIEFSHKIIEICSNEGFNLGLIGAKPEILQKAAENLKKEFPDLNIVYAQDGYFQNKSAVLDELAEKQPQLLLVALGSPKQEEFIQEARKVLSETLMIGVGGSFDVWSGVVERAPVIWQKLGLEWLYRTLKEPQRFKRIFPTLPRFILRVIFSK